MTKIPIVDENDNLIIHKERSEVLHSDIYRVSSLWIFNLSDEVLLAQRAFNKNNDPGKWGPAVAGTVEEGETYEQNIVKETEEELGIKNITVKKDEKKFRDGKHRFFVQRFITTIDLNLADVQLQEEEVAAVKWFTKDELKNLVKNKPEMFIPSMQDSIKELF